jgi:Transglycosylase SLT domain
MQRIVKLCLLASVMTPLAAHADVPVKDRRNRTEHTGANSHWLDTVKTQKGTSQSTKGVSCSWRITPENALKQRADVASKIANTCKSVGVDPAFGLSIAYQESRFNQNCKAPTTPHSGGQRAEGVMQVLPSTGRRMFRQNGLGFYNGTNEDHNIMAGCLYLAEGAKVANGSKYHIAGGYHAGYESSVWRNNLAIPKGWPKTLNYAETVTKKWYPYFGSSMRGYGGRLAADQLAANGLLSGAAGLASMQSDQAMRQQRMQEEGENIGQFDNERLEWGTNSKIRLLNADATNGVVEALAMLAQFKMLAASLDLSDESEGTAIYTSTPEPARRPDDVQVVWDAAERRWKILGADGTWRWADVSEPALIELTGSGSAPASKAGTVDAAEIQRIQSLLD